MIENMISEKHRILAEMRRLVDVAEASNRSLNELELVQYEKLKDEILVVNSRIEKQEFLLAAERSGEMRSLTHPKTDTSEFRDAKTGEPIKVYRKGQRIADNLNLVTPGAYMRSLITGPRNAAEERALGKGSGSGSYTVPTEIAQQIIDRLRETLVFEAAGMATVPIVGPTKMVKITADPTHEWHEEAGALTAYDPTLAQVSFDPKWITCLTKVNRELIAQSVNVEQAVEIALTGALRNALEVGIMRGTNANGQPKGMDSWSDIQTFDLGTNGDTLANYEDILYGLYLLQTENANPTAAVMSPRTARDFNLMIDKNDQPLQRPVAIADLPFLTTKNVSDAYTQGTTLTSTSRIYMGDYSKLYLGLLENIKLEVIKEAFVGNFQYGFLAYLAADIQPLFEKAFVRIDGVIGRTLTNTYV